MVRAESSLKLVARWLAEEVGEGSIFTKQALRQALPQFEQVDRRMRDLRGHGWQIDTNRDDPQLSANELRLVKVGYRPGQPGFVTAAPDRVSAKERVAAISGSAFRCQLCGVQIGEKDESESGFARLKVVRVGLIKLVTCEMCAVAAPTLRDGSATLKQHLLELTVEDLQRFRRRVGETHSPSALEAALALASRLPRDVALACADECLSNSPDPGSGRGLLREQI